MEQHKRVDESKQPITESLDTFVSDDLTVETVETIETVETGVMSPESSWLHNLLLVSE
jgi:hypothetical protein